MAKHILIPKYNWNHPRQTIPSSHYIHLPIPNRTIAKYTKDTVLYIMIL